MEARRIAAPFEGSRGRCGPKERGDWRGLLEMVDLKEILEVNLVSGFSQDWRLESIFWYGSFWFSGGDKKLCFETEIVGWGGLVLRLEEPLFVDPYAGCFVPPHTRMDLEDRLKHYCIATKFIDDKLLRTVNHMDGLKQVVLLSDGMDTRLYRLNWPSSTIVFDISPERVFQNAAEKLKGVGAKIPRSCLFLHVPLESSDIQQTLCMKGFNGNRPSIWAIQVMKPLSPLQRLSAETSKE
ncbi:hypothetical protein CRYUN_Cryun20dG0061500 [Craigia yunnanensis]